MKIRNGKRLGLLLTMPALIGSLLIGPVAPARAAITLPTSVFTPCSVTQSDYCIESVGVQPVGSALVALQWVPSGSSGPSVSKSEGVVAGRDLPGRWTAEGAFEGENYDGIYLEVKQANPFVPWIFADAKPTYSPGNAVKAANATATPTYAVNLNPDVAISISLLVS